MTEVALKRIKLVEKPTIIVMAQMEIRPKGMYELFEWLQDYDPDCISNPDSDDPFSEIFPHPGTEGENQRALTGNELYVELCGRGCYRSYGMKAGRKSNAEYIANLFGEPGKIPHASVLYHAKMSFFFAGISRRVSHELIRHYVGADRTEEGSPSQESTRFTHHPGWFALHPRDVNSADERKTFELDMQQAYDSYLDYLNRQIEVYQETNNGKSPTGMDRKRIYESAAQRLPGAACTSFYWTSNPMAIAKLLFERCDYAADLEIQRFAMQLRDVCYANWPNLFREANEACKKGGSL
jgi:thymidylate synthase (FAD)